METGREEAAGDGSPSLSATESIIAGLWKEVISVPGTPVATDDFFRLGGDSIGMITVLVRIQEALSVELPSSAIFAAPTLQELAAMVDAASDGSRTPVA